MLYIVLYSILVVLLFDNCLNTPFACLLSLTTETTALWFFLFSVVLLIRWLTCVENSPLLTSSVFLFWTDSVTLIRWLTLSQQVGTQRHLPWSKLFQYSHCTDLVNCAFWLQISVADKAVTLFSDLPWVSLRDSLALSLKRLLKELSWFFCSQTALTSKWIWQTECLLLYYYHPLC